MTDTSAFCESQVREFARDRYLATLFAPAQHRAELHALYAFDLEIARIPLLIHEPMAGEVRLQWWREVLQGERAGEAQANPVAAALLSMLERCRGVDRAALMMIADARTAALYGDPIETVAALERYADETAGVTVRAAMQILASDERWRRAEELSRAAGFALTVSEIVRHVARDASRGKVDIPRDVMARHGVTVEDITAGHNAEGLRAALRDLSGLARQRLAIFEQPPAAVPSEIGPAALPATVVPLYLEQIERPAFDPFRNVIDAPQWRRQWTMWRAARRFRSPRRD